MAEDIKKHTGIEAELIPGSGGVFDVAVDGETIFSKHEADRFPNHDEILEKIPV
ncbi:MAG: hypothetical protein Tsb009_37090 [Planctomycetaceae bacterium]